MNSLAVSTMLAIEAVFTYIHINKYKYEIFNSHKCYQHIHT
jgi:hypothetical protein